MVSKVQNKILVSSNPLNNGLKKGKQNNSQVSFNGNQSDSVSFTGASSTMSKKGWFVFRRLSDEMKDITEITNAIIAAIGTGIIAPLIIMASPGKGDQEDKDKKFFQAIRQPLSAGLALAFQVPMTLAINSGIDHITYKNPVGFFKDKTIGNLVPDKKYIAKHVTNDELAQWETKFKADTPEGQALRDELKKEVLKDYVETDIEVSDEKLAKRMEKKKTKFLKGKIADSKYEEFLNKKIEELSGKNFDIKDTDLVTDDNRNLAIQRNKKAYEAIETNKKLTKFDKLTRLMGFSTKRVAELEKEQKNKATEWSLRNLKDKETILFENSAEGQKARFRRFIENKVAQSQKTLSGKKFWLSLLVNLFMVSASCYALNWTHPRFKEMIDNFKNKKAQQQPTDDKKVEVAA